MIILSKIRKKKTNNIWYLLYVEFKKKIQMNLKKQEKVHRLRDQIYGYRGKGEGQER